ncbi:MAG: 30S ribosomal protein S20 [Clostridia bacterium]|nr:30S ribosomal protein S20 [Clostridia bacterium]
MPNIKSAKKRVAVSRANNERNKAARSALKTAIKKADAALEAGAKDADVAVKDAVKSIDKAAGKGLLHKNNAARKKSALVKKLNKA